MNSEIKKKDTNNETDNEIKKDNIDKSSNKSLQPKKKNKKLLIIIIIIIIILVIAYFIYKNKQKNGTLGTSEDVEDYSKAAQDWVNNQINLIVKKQNELLK